MTPKTPKTVGDAMDAAATSLPYGFLEALADHGEKALGEWLRANAPDHVAELFFSLMAVKVRTMYLRNGNRETHTDSSLLQWVAEIAYGADQLGVQWTGPLGSVYSPCQDPVEVSPNLQAVTIP